MTSSYEIEDSSQLAKRFASLAASYIDNPAIGSSDIAKIPLENLFRLLEMFRHDAFADETRLGVLALDRFNQRFSPQTARAWHTPIVIALNKALSESFAQINKTNAIEEIQSNLREIAHGNNLPPDEANKMRTFLSVFQTTLA